MMKASFLSLKLVSILGLAGFLVFGDFAWAQSRSRPQPVQEESYDAVEEEVSPKAKPAKMASASMPSSSSQMAVDATFSAPFVMGDMGQNYKTTFGGTASLHLKGLIDDSISNYISVGYYSFPLKADNVTSFRLIPIFFGFDLPGKVTQDLTAVFGVAVGGAFGWLNVPNIANMRVSGYYGGQIRPGIEYDFGEGFQFILRTPITILASTRLLQFTAYEAGLKFQF